MKKFFILIFVISNFMVQASSIRPYRRIYISKQDISSICIDYDWDTIEKHLRDIEACRENYENALKLFAKQEFIKGFQFPLSVDLMDAYDLVKSEKHRKSIIDNCVETIRKNNVDSTFHEIYVQTPTDSGYMIPFKPRKNRF